MKIKLKQLATVQMGYSFRSRLEPLQTGNVTVIQMKDLLDDNTVDCEGLVKIEMKKIKPHHLVRKGDLVFRSRGLVTTSAILVEEPDNAVVAAPLLRIRVSDQDKILPTYLNWYISQRDAQIFLNSRAKGTVQKMISKQAVEDLPVLVPSPERQKDIVELAQLAAREQQLLHQLALRREQYMASVLMQYAREPLMELVKPRMNTNKHELLLKDEVYRVVGCAMAVLNTLGYGLLEKPYENALAVEFGLNNIPYSQQARFPVIYKEVKVGEYIPDLIAFDQIVIDTKAIKVIGRNETAQMINYLKITGLEVGVILNFKYPQLDWKRIIL